MASRQERRRFLENFSTEVQNAFTTHSKYWEYEKFLGNGAYGVTVLLREKAYLVARQKRIALKLSMRGRAAASLLKREIELLKQLRGAKHIVRMLASCENVRELRKSQLRKQKISLTRVFARFGPLVRIPPITVFDALDTVLDVPAAALEYLDKGDLLSFKTFIEKNEISIPNRVLWSLFLCLIRACIGMAYPLERPEGTRDVLETIPNDDTTPSTLVHNDMAPRNVMITSGDGLDEHHVGNMFKLIDFGAATEYWPPRGSPDNLYDCSRLIVQFLGRPVPAIEPRENQDVWKGEYTRQGQILPSEEGALNDPYPRVDIDLRDLIARCAYANMNKRPTLQQALDAALAGVAKKAEEFPDPAQETDDQIRQFWQTVIFDAPANFRA
ncbi:kinase-like protein [Xylaria telfairii]|nr:kinase-like protein [Xylaria telfairii]